MKTKLAGGAAAYLIPLSAAAAVSGCSHLHWPWHRQAPPPPVPVHELEVAAAASGSFPQYWKRNTLLIDLGAAAGSGSLTLKPAAGGSWPVRLAFRVRPGAIGALEVRAAERVVLPIQPAGGAPVDLELTPGIYRPDTPQITVSWAPEVTPE
ncbi:MAG TPA: hypothetical protein VKQ31_02285 [Steroidobacteraceae bacterium]|nr:hypothetical protein [Steroidobacteraceae bacterium]